MPDPTPWDLPRTFQRNSISTLKLAPLVLGMGAGQGSVGGERELDTRELDISRGTTDRPCGIAACRFHTTVVSTAASLAGTNRFLRRFCHQCEFQTTSLVDLRVPPSFMKFASGETRAGTIPATTNMILPG